MLRRDVVGLEKKEASFEADAVKDTKLWALADVIA